MGNEHYYTSLQLQVPMVYWSEKCQLMALLNTIKTLFFILIFRILQ